MDNTIPKKSSANGLNDKPPVTPPPVPRREGARPFTMGPVSSHHHLSGAIPNMNDQMPPTTPPPAPRREGARPFNMAMAGPPPSTAMDGIRDIVRAAMAAKSLAALPPGVTVVSSRGSQQVPEPAGTGGEEMDVEMGEIPPSSERLLPGESPASFLRRWMATNGWNNRPRDVFPLAAQPVTTEERLWCWCRANRNDPRVVFAEQARRRCEIQRYQLMDGRWLELRFISIIG